MTEAKSAQPQLPPRPERVTDESGFYTLHQADEADAYMNALEAENESLKVQLEERNNRGTGFLYVPKAAYEVVKAERNKALEVIREYRQLHSKELGCFGGFNELSSVLCVDKRCPTCIQADALLKEKK